MHEFFCTGAEDACSTAGFIAGILSALNRNRGPSIWISSSPVFPPALTWFGLEPHKIIFIDLKKEKEKLWAMEEALRCDGLSSVVADINEISFTESRRLQLAVEQTRVTGFLLRRNPKNLSTSCVTRWKVAPLAAAPRSDLPGIGLPGWNVSLLKVRNGQPGSWQMQWSNGRFTLVQAPGVVIRPMQRKIV
jgi:protein ImuA